LFLTEGLFHSCHAPTQEYFGGIFAHAIVQFLEALLTEVEKLKAATAHLLPRAERLLCNLITLPSLSGNEEPAIKVMAETLQRGPGKVIFVPLLDEMKSDPDYSFIEAGINYANRHNLYYQLRGNGEGRSAILQTHLDVVPAGDWMDAFNPYIEDGVVFGRGACDCKGQAVTLWLTLTALAKAGITLKGDVLAQLVVEEEIGGNGALAAILDGDRADAGLILEPTSMQIHPACRGACWFRYTVSGRAVHMGRRHEGVNAFEKAMKLCNALLDYETRLIADSRNQPLFERYEHPVQVNIGVVRAGEWPSMVPDSCVIEGGVGFLPNKPMREVVEDLQRLIQESGDSWLIENTKLEFPKLHNDAYKIDPNHPAVLSLAAACKATGLESEVFGWNVSCDARLYALRGNMPAIVFGPGDIAHAHSNHEQIRMDDISKAAVAIASWLMDWCGVVEVN
jgi:acetylornithine deacetylase